MSSSHKRRREEQSEGSDSCVYHMQERSCLGRYLKGRPRCIPRDKHADPLQVEHAGGIAKIMIVRSVMTNTVDLGRTHMIHRLMAIICLVMGLPQYLVPSESPHH